MKLHILIAATLVACSSPGGRAASVEHKPVAAQPRPKPMSTEPSIYDMPMQLRGADASTIGLDTARGRPVIVSMFYASCTVACPLLLSEVRQVVAELPPEMQREVRILMVSFDPARDTPAKLAEVMSAYRLDERWTLAAANAADARALAAMLRVKYRKLDNGEFAHGSTIVALDRDGRPIARTDALGHRAPLIEALTP